MANRNEVERRLPQMQAELSRPPQLSSSNRFAYLRGNGAPPLRAERPVDPRKNFLADLDKTYGLPSPGEEVRSVPSRPATLSEISKAIYRK